MKVLPRVFLGSAALFLLSSVPAFAHVLPGEPRAFSTGFGHPLHGLDHILAMFAVGLWAAQLGGRALWAIPAAFITLMTLGGALGIGGLHLPGVETGIALSVLLLGLLIVFAVRLPVGAGIALVGLFALFHGHAHGTEMAGSLSAVAYCSGFLLATGLLHAAGMLAGLGLQTLGRLPLARLAGGAIALSSVFLFVG